MKRPRLLLLPPLVSLVSLALATGASAQTQIQGQVSSRPAAGGVNLGGAGTPRTWALLCCTANDLYSSPAPYEGSWTEILQFNYESGLFLDPHDPAQLRRLLQDRDAFPATPLMAYETLRFGHGIPDARLTLMLYHDDEAGFSRCEFPLPEDDTGGDEWISWRLPPPAGPPANALYGPDGASGTADDPQIDHETLVAGQGAHPVTRQALIDAIRLLARHAGLQDQVFLYLVDHGADPAQLGAGALYFEAGEATPDPGDDFLTGAELDEILDQAFAGANLPALLVTLADCCYADAFLQPLLVPEGMGEEHRVTISSSAADRLSWYHLESMAYPVLAAQPPVYPGFGAAAATPAGSLFFWPLWAHVQAGASLVQAFDRALNFVPAPAFFGGGSVLQLQQPVLVDHAAPGGVRVRQVLADGSDNWNDLEWRPQGDYALVVGKGELVSQYRWNPLRGAAGDYELSVLHRSGATQLNQVCWEWDGAFAVAAGGNGQVWRIDHNGGSPTVSAAAVAPAFATTTWTGCAAVPPWTEMGKDGIDAVLVGFHGEVGLYRGLGNVVVAAAVQGGSQDYFQGCDVNSLSVYTPPSYPCDHARVTDEVLIVGTGGAWRYSYTNGWRDPNCGSGLHDETLTRILNRPGATLLRCKWDPQQLDEAVCAGAEGGVGLLARLDAADLWTTCAVPEVGELGDLDYKPDLAFVLAGGAGRSFLAVEPARLDRYRLLAAANGYLDVQGVDWRPTNSQATAASAYYDLGIGFVRGSLEEVTHEVDF